ncbi:MAG: hypothetical protein ACM3OO_05155 [Planctomycetaceae bacterium]
MNKRSALLTAGGLATSFAAGAAAFSVNWGLGTSNASTVAAATPTKTAAPKVKPIIKHRTVVVHKKAPATPGSAGSPSLAPQTVVVPAPAPAVAPATAPKPAVTHTSASPTAGGEHESEGGGDD